MESEQVRRQRVNWGLAVAPNVLVMPSPYERGLLEKYVCGSLTLEEIILLLEMREQAAQQKGKGA
jgi:hypothetical protein